MCRNNRKHSRQKTAWSKPRRQYLCEVYLPAVINPALGELGLPW
jgi:hypothetical protein